MIKFWKWSDAVESDDSELILEGPIASETWWGDEVTPQEFREELKKHQGKALTVVLNSAGGDVFAGISIYNALRELDAEVTIRVDGLAASIASIIAMAGDKVIMSPGSMMMIHRPSVFAAGNVDDLEKAKEVLLTIEESIVPIYAERTGLDTKEIEDMLEAETWMSAERTVELGFADEVAKSDKPTVKQTIQNVLNGNLAYSMSATQKSLKSFVDKIALSQKEGEDVVKPNTTEKPVVPAPADETETKVKEDTPEPEDEPTEIVDPVVPEVSNSTKKETDMKKNQEIAKDQVVTPIAPSDQAPVDAKPKMKDYLKAKASMEAFARILEEQAGKTSDDVKDAWKEHLEVTMGVTNPEVFLPDALITDIEDAFKEGGEIWNRVTKTGADVWKAAWDAATDPSAEAGRGKGYNREDEEEKAEQELTFATRILRPQFVYKYITLNKEDVKNQRSTGALVRFVLSELPRRIVREVERAIVLSDGRLDGSDYKIQEGNPAGFYPIINDAVAENVFAELYTPEVDEDHYASVVKANDLLEAEGARVLISKKGYVTDMKLTRNEQGGYIFPLGADFNGILGVDAVIQPDWFNDTTSPDVDAILVVLSNYRVVGDTSIEAFTNFILKTNKQEYLQEIWAGGGLTVRKTAVAIATEATS